MFCFFLYHKLAVHGVKHAILAVEIHYFGVHSFIQGVVLRVVRPPVIITRKERKPNLVYCGGASPPWILTTLLM